MSIAMSYFWGSFWVLGFVGLGTAIHASVEGLPRALAAWRLYGIKCLTWRNIRSGIAVVLTGALAFFLFVAPWAIGPAVKHLLYR